MARMRQFIDANVLDEARRRMHHVYDTFDNVVVAFSGGKDSLATLHLVHQVAEERGIKRVKAVFRDEEVIPFEVVQFVEEVRAEYDWLDLEWWAVPLVSHLYILGESTTYVQFDPDREWVRQPPDYAVTLADMGLPADSRLTQYEVDDLTVRDMKGKCAIVTGVRAAESILRYRSCVNKLNENYIVASSSKKASMVRPIFDWAEDDVFRFFYDYDIRYCPIYDQQGWAGSKLRVCSALATEPARNNWGQHREFAPDLYEAIMRVFPQMQAQERYYREYDQDAIIDRHATSWEAIGEWIDENIEDPRQHAKARSELAAVRIRADRVPESYPLPYVMKVIMATGGKRTIQPLRADDGAKVLVRAEKRKAARAASD